MKKHLSLGPLCVVMMVLGHGLAGCSGDNPTPGGPDASSEVAPDAKQAADAVDEGLEAHAAGKLEEAADAYNTALESDPTNQYALYNLALIDEADSNYGLAEEKYRAAIETDADYEPALFNLAILLSDSDPSEAIGLYQRAVEAEPKDAAAWLNLGLLQRTHGEERAGDKAVLRAVALNPDLQDPLQPADAARP